MNDISGIPVLAAVPMNRPGRATLLRSPVCMGCQSICDSVSHHLDSFCSVASQSAIQFLTTWIRFVRPSVQRVSFSIFSGLVDSWSRRSCGLHFSVDDHFSPQRRFHDCCESNHAFIFGHFEVDWWILPTCNQPLLHFGSQPVWLPGVGFQRVP